MSAPIAECHTCSGRVFRCTVAGDEVAECADCGLIWGRFSVGSPASVIDAPVEFGGAQ